MVWIRKGSAVERAVNDSIMLGLAVPTLSVVLFQDDMMQDFRPVQAYTAVCLTVDGHGIDVGYLLA